MRSQPALSVDFDPLATWYGKVRFPKQEQMLFDPHGPDGCPFWQGFLGGRGASKTFTAGRKTWLLSALNPTPEGDTRRVMIAMMGRSMTEVQQKMLPPFYEACADFRRATGVQWITGYDTDLQEIYFANGSGMYLLSYNDMGTLNRMGRGLNLAAVIVDELMWGSGVSSDAVVKTITPAIRDPRAKHKCFVWFSSPNGLRGIAKKHKNHFGDPNWFLVHATARDNPYMLDEDIARLSEGLSKSEIQQEIDGICLQPGAAVFHEFDEDRHIIPWRWSSRCRNVIGIDWGKGHAYICAIQVTEDGRWIVAAERKVTDTTRLRFRKVVEEFVEEVKDASNREIFMMACDRAVKSERNWLTNRFDDEVEAGVRYLTKKRQQRIDWGLNCISGMLDPVIGDSRLFLAASLSSSTDDAAMGLRGAFTEYVNVQYRAPDGELITIDEPSKKTNADHPMDALRYAICCSVDEEVLHGGHLLPVLDESSPTEHDDEDGGRDSEGRGRR